jgi:hypothetical protein
MPETVDRVMSVEAKREGEAAEANRKNKGVAENAT